MSSYDATRTVKLWLDNEEGSYREAVALANEALKHACDGESHALTARSDAAESLAREIEAMVCRSMPCANGLWGDLISHVLSEIDFEDAAMHYLDDLEIWAVFSSSSEEAELFTNKDDAVLSLEDKLDSDNTLHAGIFKTLAQLDDGGRVDIEGVTYCLVKC